MVFDKFIALVSGGALVLVEFYAVWNGACLVTRKAVDELADLLDGHISIMRINIDSPEYYRITQAYNIYSVPTLMLFHNGRVVWRTRGVSNVRELKKITVRLLHETIAL